MAQRIDAELYVIYVDIGKDDTPEYRRTLQENFRFAENIGAQILRSEGKNVAEK